MRSRKHTLRGTVVATAAVLITSAAVTAAPAAAKLKCADIPHAKSVQAANNIAGAVYDPVSNTFTIFDNSPRDDTRVSVEWNYAEIRDRWKRVGFPADGDSQTFERTVPRRRSLRNRQLCYRLVQSVSGGTPTRIPRTTRRYTS